MKRFGYVFLGLLLNSLVSVTAHANEISGKVTKSERSQNWESFVVSAPGRETLYRSLTNSSDKELMLSIESKPKDNCLLSMLFIMPTKETASADNKLELTTTFFVDGRTTNQSLSVMRTYKGLSTIFIVYQMDQRFQALYKSMQQGSRLIVRFEKTDGEFIGDQSFSLLGFRRSTDRAYQLCTAAKTKPPSQTTPKNTKPNNELETLESLKPKTVPKSDSVPSLNEGASSIPSST